MHYVTNYLWNRTPAKLPAPSTSNGPRNGFVAALIQISKSIPSFWEEATLEQLQWMKNILTISQWDKEHEFSKKVEQALLKCSAAARNCFVPDSGTPLSLEAAKCKEGFLATKTLISVPSTASASNQFSQDNLRIEQVEEILKANGGQYQEMNLNFVNDALLKIVSEYCPQLTSLTISYGIGSPMMHFTDAGLGYIGKLTQLTKLELDIWLALYVTSQAFQNFLSLPQLQNNLKELSLMTPLAGNEALQVIAKYQQLSKLKLWSASITPQGSEYFVQSSASKNTLQSLEIRQLACWGAIVTDPVLRALALYPNLQELSFNGQWQVTDQNLQNLLAARQKLIKLKLDGYTISSLSAAKMSTMTGLQELHLGDCSKLAEADYTTLLQFQNNLASLSLDNCLALTDHNMLSITVLPNLRSLALQHCSWLLKGIEVLSSSPNMQASLNSLHLSHNKGISSASLCTLGKLTSLKILRIDSFPKFNDDSLRAILRSPVKNSLEVLELNNVSIADEQALNLSQLTNMQILMLAKCSAITKMGTLRLLNSIPLQSQLQKFYIDGAVITEEMVKSFNHFTKLQVLIVGNADGLNSMNCGGIFKLPNLKKMNTHIKVFWGEMTSFDSFEKAT